MVSFIVVCLWRPDVQMCQVKKCGTQLKIVFDVDSLIGTGFYNLKWKIFPRMDVQFFSWRTKKGFWMIQSEDDFKLAEVLKLGLKYISLIADNCK